MNCNIVPTSIPEHEQFLAMLPVIRFQAQSAFRTLQYDIRQEQLSEVIGHAWQAFVRLCETGKTGQANAWTLAQFAVRAVRSGRRTGNSQNSLDITSRIHRRNEKAARRRQLEKPDRLPWQEFILADQRASPDQLAMARLDFGDWLATLPTQKRQVAEFLANGESTRDAAEQFGLTAGRISQIRKELEQSWNTFQSGMTLVNTA